MASTKTLNARNLETLGAATLAGLLMEVSTGNAVAQRRLRLALAGNAGPAEAARAIGKRLAAIARSKTYVGWEKVRPLVVDLAAQQAAIVGQVAPADPRTAFQLTWRLVACADGVFGRSDDGSGRLSGVFQEAARTLGQMARAAALDPAMLVEMTFEAVCDNRHGQWDELVDVMAPALDVAGLDMLRQKVIAWQAERPATPPRDERRVVAWSGRGPTFADEVEAGHRRRTASRILQQLADLRGDVDGYVAQFEEAARKTPVVASRIARRLLDAGRPGEALAAIEGVDPESRRGPTIEWELARIDTLVALGRADEAQAFRWEQFAATLNAAHLRAHLRALPDFEDFEAEQRAMALAIRHDDVHAALAFLIGWPAPEQASRLVLGRATELDGDLYELLGAAADVLAGRHPLAAMLVLRAMIDATLGHARSTRYRHAARHLAEAGALATTIDDLGGTASHAAYEERLREMHGRKAAFWLAASDLAAPSPLVAPPNG